MKPKQPTQPVKIMATRHERKMIRNAKFELAEKKRLEEQAKIEQFKKQHPITSGLIPLVDYVAPK